MSHSGILLPRIPMLLIHRKGKQSITEYSSLLYSYLMSNKDSYLILLGLIAVFFIAIAATITIVSAETTKLFIIRGTVLSVVALSLLLVLFVLPLKYRQNRLVTNVHLSLALGSLLSQVTPLVGVSIYPLFNIITNKSGLYFHGLQYVFYGFPIILVILVLTCIYVIELFKSNSHFVFELVYSKKIVFVLTTIFAVSFFAFVFIILTFIH